MSDLAKSADGSLVSGQSLQARLGDPELRVFDCTTHLVYEENTGRPYKVVSGRPEHEEAHIPGAGYLDLQQDFSRQDSPYRFTLPAPRDLADAFERHGIGDQTFVVLYSRKSSMWATRFWWMLRWLGFDNAAVLDGGFEKWVAEDRPTDSEPNEYQPGSLSIQLRPDLFVDKEAVSAAIGEKTSCTINALSPDLHAGDNARYGRPGRVPGSLNVPAASLVDPVSKTFAGLEEAAKVFESAGVTKDKHIIAYCGGGIAATLDAFVLTQLGFTDIGVYDNSMSEWATDYSLPIETD